MDELGKLAFLESKHRKEKKELQAQIQALKKTAKNDKTKKKELLAEIARLESEQDNRHKIELENVQIEHNERITTTAETNEEGEENDNAKVKISKAQKRRDKKLQQDREREEQIKQQEKENIHGPRNTEIQVINAKLKKRQLKIFPIASDGDCLYKAVAHQLQVKKQQLVSVDELRKTISNYMLQHKDDFLPFMSNSETYEMLTDKEFEDYCNKILTTKVWGGQLEIRALSNSLKCPISVIQASGPETIEQGTEFDGDPLIITYHRHMYSLGEHYNSTCLDENADDENN